MIPDWQLPPGVDRGLWDYLHSGDMVRGYDDQMAASPLAQADVAFCERAFPTPGRLVDLGCGTGRLCLHFAAKGYDCVGVDLSDEMLARARENTLNLTPQPPSLERKGEQIGSGLEAPPFLGEGLGRGCLHLTPQPPSLERKGEPEPGLGRGSAHFLKANLVDLSELPDASFDYAACLFSTLGMVRGRENRAKVLANAVRLLKPGGLFVLHAHNRFFRGLGWGRVAGQFLRTAFDRRSAGDITMSQAYGGSPLTLHHFTKREALAALREAGFRPLDSTALGIDGGPAGWPNTLRAYGWLILAERG